MKKKIRVVIAGASGFIGNALYKRLKVNARFEVLPFSRSKSKGCIQVKNYNDCPSGDVLLHLAQNSNRNLVNMESYKFIEKEKQKEIQVFNGDFKHIIYVSSSSLYDDTLYNKPIHENLKLSINDNYSSLKNFSEKLCIKKNGTIVRLANVYGPGMSVNNVINEILSQIFTNYSINISNFSSIRDFIWIDDLTAILEIMILKRISGIFNVGTEKPLSILQIIKIILKAYDLNSIEINCRGTTEKKSYICLDMNKTKNNFKWEASTTFLQGMLKLRKMNYRNLEND